MDGAPGTAGAPAGIPSAGFVSPSDLLNSGTTMPADSADLRKFDYSIMRSSTRLSWSKANFSDYRIIPEKKGWTIITTFFKNVSTRLLASFLAAPDAFPFKSPADLRSLGDLSVGKFGVFDTLFSKSSSFMASSTNLVIAIYCPFKKSTSDLSVSFCVELYTLFIESILFLISV